MEYKARITHLRKKKYGAYEQVIAYTDTVETDTALDTHEPPFYFLVKGADPGPVEPEDPDEGDYSGSSGSGDGTQSEVIG